MPLIKLYLPFYKFFLLHDRSYFSLYPTLFFHPLGFNNTTYAHTLIEMIKMFTYTTQQLSYIPCTLLKLYVQTITVNTLTNSEIQSYIHTRTQNITLHTIHPNYTNMEARILVQGLFILFTLHYFYPSRVMRESYLHTALSDQHA